MKRHYLFLLIWISSIFFGNFTLSDPDATVQKSYRSISSANTTILSDFIQFNEIPAGSFRMGSPLTVSDTENERPVHTVALPAFFMCAKEITQKQFTQMMGFNPSVNKGNGDLPVERVSWIDAARFCNRLSDAAGLFRCYDEKTWKCDFTKNGYRLPTEAEWEYACRAATTTEYHSGDSEEDLTRVG